MNIGKHYSRIKHVHANSHFHFIRYLYQFKTLTKRIIRVFAAVAARGTSSVWTRCRLHLDRLDRYHGAGALVMTCGAVGMMASALLAIAPLWAGFLAGALPSLFLTALVYPEHA